MPCEHNTILCHVFISHERINSVKYRSFLHLTQIAECAEIYSHKRNLKCLHPCSCTNQCTISAEHKNTLRILWYILKLKLVIGYSLDIAHKTLCRAALLLYVCHYFICKCKIPVLIGICYHNKMFHSLFPVQLSMRGLNHTMNIH